MEGSFFKEWMMKYAFGFLMMFGFVACQEKEAEKKVTVENLDSQEVSSTVVQPATTEEGTLIFSSESSSSSQNQDHVEESSVNESSLNEGVSSSEDVVEATTSLIYMTHDTYFKESSQDSSQIQKAGGCVIGLKKGTLLSYISSQEAGIHEKVSLSQMLSSENCSLKDGYLYRGHIEKRGSFSSAASSSQEPSNHLSENLVSQNADIRILMYHDIPKDVASLSSQDDVALPHFEEQLDTLMKKGYTTISLREFTDYQKGNGKVPKKSILMTFDDGYIGNFKDAIPALKKRNMKAVFFVHTAYVGVPTSKDHMTWDMLREVDQSPLFEVESHTVTHPKLAEKSGNELQRELKISKETIERELNKKVIGIAYPFGSYNTQTISMAKSLGYEVGLAVAQGMQGDKMFTFTRFGIGKDVTSVEKFLARIKL